MASATPPSVDSSSLVSQTPELPYRKTSIEKKRPPLPKKGGNIFSEKLNLQQWRFIEFYMRGEKPYTAAKHAGYAESTCLVAHDVLLNHPEIQDEIQKRVDRYFKEIGASEQRIIQNALRFSESNLFDYGYVDTNGHFVVDLSNVPRELGYAIQEYSVDSQGRPRIKLVNKLAATELLGKFRGMGSEKVQLTGKDGAPLTIQALDAIVAQNVVINQQTNIISPPVEQKQLPQTVDAEVVKVG